jgi:hypothetical protein
VVVAVLAALAALVGAGGCAFFNPLTEDQFQCGIPVESFDGTSRAVTVSRCDGEGEVCLCGEHRCAVPASTRRCPSGLAYRFPAVMRDPDGGDCVPDDLQALGPRIPDDFIGPYCPGEDPTAPATCGVPHPDGGYATCPAGHSCVCGDIKKCAVMAPDCGADGGAPLRYVQDWQCAGDLGSAPMAQGDGSCPGYGPSPPSRGETRGEP